MANVDDRINLLDLPYPSLEALVAERFGWAKYRAQQIWQWIWARNVRDIDSMTDIAREAREVLKKETRITLPKLVLKRESSDGTVKFLLRLEDGECIETVLIPSEGKDGKKRLSQCLSSQVGCAMACTFCSTGKLGFKRNMTMGEILGQLQVAREYVGDNDPSHPVIRNLVYMGMGEPLLNLSAVMDSLRTLNSPRGLAFSPRRITVSTCGIEKGLRELGESGLAFLAVSLHAPTQELRERIMPRAAAWHLEEMLSALEQYPLGTRERITLEYLVMHGINDGDAQVRELAKICSRLKAKLNLIPYNDTPGSPYAAPTPEQMLAFEKKLWAKNITAIARKSKGGDIEAACGQLRAAHDADA